MNFMTLYYTVDVQVEIDFRGSYRNEDTLASILEGILLYSIELLAVAYEVWSFIVNF